MFKKIWVGCLLLPLCVSHLAQAETVVDESSKGSVESLASGNVNLRSILAGDLLKVSWQGARTEIVSPNSVKSVYDSLGYRLLWSKDNRLTREGNDLIQRVLASKYDALLPETYHANVFSSVTQNTKIYDPELLDVILTDSFVTLKSHLANGIVDPKKQFKEWNTPRQAIYYPSSVKSALESGGVLRELRVNDPNYQALKKDYTRLYQENLDSTFTKIPATKLSLGAYGPSVAILRSRLGLSEGNRFDAELKAAVKNYQKENNLSADGVVGRNTLNLLNQSPSDKLEILAINMERFRWANIPVDTNYIWVNIPAYKMEVIKNGMPSFKSNVIVGRGKRPTPVFSDTLQYVVLNPYWNVPRTIYKEDKLPRLRKDPYSLGPNFQVLSKATGKVVDPASVNWDTESDNYRLRQLPGRTNALGRMKFLFPNSHDIYLHDTPSRQLFKRGNRDISSGCVRVEHAHEFADFLLGKMNWNPEKVTKYTTGEKEKWVKLSEQLNYPVFLNYYTAWVDDEKHVVFSRDIYDKDNALKVLYRQKLTSYM